jgi:hypothetical protein
VTLVTGAAVLAGILDAEKLQALVILLAATSNRGKLIATTAVERRCGPALFPSTPAAAAAASWAAPFAGAGRTAACGARAAALG